MTRQAVVFSFPSREALEAEIARLERERAAQEFGIEPPSEPIRVAALVGEERPAIEA